jgi:DNA-binding GntR family transcriptional regulator
MAVRLPLLQRQTVSEQVVAVLRQKIRSGELPQGHRLREVELAEQLGVSRGTLREAFRHLIGERLLVVRPHRGTYVWGPSPRETWELFTLRAGVEGIAVRLVLMAGKRAELISKLHAIVTKMATLEARGELPEEADQEFHETIVRLSGNRRLWQIWSTVHPSVWLATLPADSSADGTAVALAKSHERLVEALARATPAEAQEKLVRHVLDAVAEMVPGDDPASGSGD